MPRAPHVELVVGTKIGFLMSRTSRPICFSMASSMSQVLGLSGVPPVPNRDEEPPARKEPQPCQKTMFGTQKP